MKLFSGSSFDMSVKLKLEISSDLRWQLGWKQLKNVDEDQSLELQKGERVLDEVCEMGQPKVVEPTLGMAGKMK